MRVRTRRHYEICGRACRTLAALALPVALLAAPVESRADDPPPSSLPLRWDPAWTHANAWDYSLASVGVAALTVEAAVLQNRSQSPRWIGPILFDGAINDVVRARTQAVHDAAETGSWVLWFGLVGYPLVVDVPHAWIRYGRGVAWDLFWQDATALSLAGAVDFALRDSVARLRPSNTQCLDPGETHCAQAGGGPEATRSFPSGHLTEVTTGTALICTQHLTMHLYGDPWDGVTCASAVTADAAVAVLKLVADDHWATDILAGAALGVAFGWGLPVLMHLRGQTQSPQYGDLTGMLVAPVPVVYDRGGGLGVVGLF